MLDMCFRYDVRRVVMKIGQRPTAFFMIISGTVFVNTQEKSERDGHDFMRTVNEMGPGEILGVRFHRLTIFC